jgi:hypothetical protein
MNGSETTKRLQLVEDAFRTLASCAQQIRQSKMVLEEGGFVWALGSIGSRLLLAAQYGPEGEVRLLEHWKAHSEEICKELISRAQRSGEQRIRTDDVVSMFRKAPPPTFP